AREAVMGQLSWSARLREAICPDELQPALYSAIGDLADTAAYIALDVGAYEEARRVFRFALACAEEAEDWHLRAEVLSDMAVLAIRTGEPDEALTLSEQALVRADRLTATERSMLHIDRARALAKMRRVNETLTAVGLADDHFAQSTPDNDPPYMTYYNAAIHAGLTARPLVDLAMLGRDPGEATNRLTTAVAGHTTGHARPRALDLTKLASLTMTTGDPIQAVTIGNEALDVAGAIRSAMTANDLRELAYCAAPHQSLAEVAHLRHRIGNLLSGYR
ncbi:MAG: tetratricopeptide repeat protein, partial [Pseudonocardiaceae bacterium]